MKKEETKPAIAAPIKNQINDFEPYKRNAIHTPGNAEWAMASPIKLCFRSKVKLPTTPLAIPRSIVPINTHWVFGF